MSAATPEIQTPVQKVGLEETVESLNGFDEIAVKLAFGRELEDMGAFASMRAAVFVLLRRQGTSDAEAHQQVMHMPLKAVQEHFTDFDEDDPSSQGDLFPDEPDTPVGKGDSQPGEPLTS